MSTRYWIYAGPHGDGGPVSTDELALLLRERMLTTATPVRPVSQLAWMPLAEWLPELAPFAVPAVTSPPQPPPQPPQREPLPPPQPSPWTPAPQPAPQPQAPPPTWRPEPEPPIRLTEPPPSPATPPPLPRKGEWTDARPHPWRRYLARMFDNLVVGSVTWLAISTLLFIIAPEHAERFFGFIKGPLGPIADIMLTLVAVIPGNALMIGLTGVSPGKWLFGIKVVRPSGRPIGFLAALGREIQVWCNGLFFGVPLMSLFTLGGSYLHLKENRCSAWDPPRRRVVLHRPMNALQVFLIIVALALLIAIRLGIALASRPS